MFNPVAARIRAVLLIKLSFKGFHIAFVGNAALSLNELTSSITYIPCLALSQYPSY